ncbi:hypothetical protein AB0L14_14255 [Streptomyces sp. NPDC052727]|uniref:hypothetical protein n=1 Tax=Streptomyces sp. NPDC052727 TaxID=3154854 RepID=UPI00341AEDE9
MEIEVQISPDPSGFLRRACPSCEREFKWFHGETEGRPEDFLDPENYFCPYCGIPSGKDSWWTTSQLEYAESCAAGPAMSEITRMLQESFKSNKSRKSGISFELRVDASATPEPLSPPIDPDDMLMVQSPCHPWEPLKVLDDWLDPIHCLVCGNRFAL